MRLLPLLTCAAVAFFLSGCSKTEEPQAAQPPARKSAISGASATIAPGDDSLLTGKFKRIVSPAADKDQKPLDIDEIELAGNHTFKETTPSGPVEGSWVFKDTTLTLTAAKKNGKPADADAAKPIDFDAANNGNTLIHTDTSDAGTGTTIFKKQG